MIRDLIDLYFYIRRTKNVEDLTGWAYGDAEFSHYVMPDIETSLLTQETFWRFNISVGNENESKNLYLIKDRIIVFDTKRSKFSHTIQIPQFITERESDKLMQHFSTDEISIMNQIYLEMRKLLNRSKQDGAIKSE